MEAPITKSDIDQLLHEMSSQNQEIAAIGKSFREISSSLNQLISRINRMGIDNNI